MRRALFALLLLAVGCTAPSDPPSDAVSSAWTPPDQPRAVVVALHGFNDYRAAFAEFGAFAAARGVAVEAYDQPGFGATSERGSWPGTPALVAGTGRRPLPPRAPAIRGFRSMSWARAWARRWP